LAAAAPAPLAVIAAIAVTAPRAAAVSSLSSFLFPVNRSGDDSQPLDGRGGANGGNRHQRVFGGL